MADKMLVFLVLSAAYVHSAVLKGRAFYCRDPDTGKLHAVNTTWTAASFCGNYTCNIRRRNVTLPSNAPIREFNITHILDQLPNETDKEETKVAVTIEKKIEPNLQPLLHKVLTPDPSMYYNEQNKHRPIAHNCKKQTLPNLSDQIIAENDRYLTEKEIDSISDLLHTVKKSDLDAIVDIYNLAQDIYKEMDETTTEEINRESVKIVRDKEIHRSPNVKTLSYWYDPEANKEKMGAKYNMDVRNILNVISTEKPKLGRPSYYNEAILNNDIRKKSHYYPVTQFQRISSYTHPTYSYKTTTQNADVTKNFEIPNEEVQYRNTVENNNGESRKLIQPSHYLPYPFTNIHPYNLTESRNTYYGSPWLVDHYNRFKYYQPHYNAYIGPIQKAVLINPHLNNEVQGVEQHSIEQPEVKKEQTGHERDLVDTLLNGERTPNWKTGPVSMEVLKDIRADIDTTRLLKAFPLRKKVKLERVGKIMNMDDLNSQANRNKRFATEHAQKDNATELEEYETFLERVTCQDQIQLGYFRIGNLTQPYPECCPQLIDTR